MDIVNLASAILSAIASVIAILTYFNVVLAKREIRMTRDEIAEVGHAKTDVIVFPHSGDSTVPLQVFLRKWVQFLGGDHALEEELRQGHQAVRLANHTQLRSIDVLCRQLVQEQGIGNQDGMQATGQFFAANPGVFVKTRERPATWSLAAWVRRRYLEG